MRCDPSRGLPNLDTTAHTMLQLRSSSIVEAVQFSRDLREAVASGRITVSFRLWRRPQVKVATRYAVDSVHIEIDSIEVMPFSAVTDDDVQRSGEHDLEALRARAAHAGPIDDQTLLYRVEFHVVDDAGPA
jgi:hypothetical protein